MNRSALIMLTGLTLAACGDGGTQAARTTDAEQAASLPGTGATAFVDANIWDGTGPGIHDDKALIVRDGRIEGLADNVPEGAAIVSLRDRWIIPGIINTHGHVSGRWADDESAGPADRVRGDLALYARYGVTTVLSQGGIPDAALDLRNENDDPELNHARLFVSGTVVDGRTTNEAASQVSANAQRGVDWIKLRVDDNLGSAEKMPWPAVEAAIEQARAAGLPVTTHVFYQDDAFRLLDLGTGMIAHSVRDRMVSDEFVQKMLDAGICYVPTLVREVSTFVYADRPQWFDDPFFLEAAKQSEIDRVSDPGFMARVKASPAAAGYRKALIQAQENLRIMIGSGVPVAFGTDSGPAGRFPGYFEHLEFGLMAEAGLTPLEILTSGTSVAAACLGLDDLGTLEAGNRADFVVLADDPTADIAAMRTIEKVYVAGNEVPR